MLVRGAVWGRGGDPHLGGRPGAKPTATKPVEGPASQGALMTQTKIFSGAATAYGAEPNTQADAVTLGLPGVLPVLNQQAVKMAVKFGIAVDAKIAERCVFARKHFRN